MSTENKNVNTSNNEGESIKPIPWEKRTIAGGLNTYALARMAVSQSELWQWDPLRWRQVSI